MVCPGRTVKLMWDGETANRMHPPRGPGTGVSTVTAAGSRGVHRLPWRVALSIGAILGCGRLKAAQQVTRLLYRPGLSYPPIYAIILEWPRAGPVAYGFCRRTDRHRREPFARHASAAPIHGMEENTTC